MASEILELEGTWEEILKHSVELAGRRVYLKAYPPDSSLPGEINIRPENLAALEVLEELKENPLSEEDQRILEDFEKFRKDHPIRFRVLEAPP